MCKGEKRRLIVPAQLGYGENPVGDIPRIYNY
jgi:FKBP-type peptidyl-prolyl cis-trans isomerase